MAPIRILELRSVLGSGGGPEKTILHGTARTNPQDFAISVCYIRDGRDPHYDLAERARTLGVDYVEIVERQSFDWRVWPELVSICRARRIELVHAHDYKTDLLAWLLSRKLGTVPMATAHGWTGHTWRERFVYYPADKRLLARFPRVVAVSGDVRTELIRTGARSDVVRVVLNGIDAERFVRVQGAEETVRAELAVPAGAFVIGSVGRLEPQKRFDLLLDAVLALRAEHPAIFVIIAGSGSLHAELQAHIDRTGLGQSARLLGHYRDIPRLHHAFDMFVQSSDYEGTSNAVLEAMAMGTPVVATDAGGTGELLREGVEGLIVPRGSAPALAAAISTLFTDAPFRIRLRDAARERVEGPLSFASRMAAVERIYRELRPAGSRGDA